MKEITSSIALSLHIHSKIDTICDTGQEGSSLSLTFYTMPNI